MSDESGRDGGRANAAADSPASGGRRPRGILSRTARIARWEVARSAGTVDRKTVVLLVGTLLVAGVVALSVAGSGLGLEDEIYTVGVDEGNPYHDVAVESDQFRPVPLREVETDGGEANVDVLVVGDEISYAGDDGPAAYEAFRDAIDEYNERLMTREADEAAAYPVLVEIEYQDRTPAESGADDGSGAGTTDDERDGEPADGDGTTDPNGGSDATDPDGDGSDPVDDSDGNERGDPGGESGRDDEDGGDGEGGNDDEVAAGDGDDADGADDESRVPSAGDSADGEGAVGPPGSLSPPFPFQSLVLAFLFVVPMNAVIQAYGSTIVDERIKRRGELLLVSPASRYEIVAGKTLPYLSALVAITVGIAVAVGGGPVSVAAAIPIALLFLAATFVGAMLARSFKELTFVTVTISVGLTTYAFIPAIFADVTPIALISPLTLVVMDLQGDPVRAGEYLFSTGPFYLGAAVCFLFGIGLYREEDMFDQKAVPAKVIDAIAVQIDVVSRRAGTCWAPFVLSILFIPFVFAGQLLAVALLFAVPESIALPAVFVLAAAIEEAAKSVHVYAGFARSRFEPSLRTAALLGALSGLGFFVGEKVTHAVQFVGLPELRVGAAAFGPALSGDPLVLLGVFLAPLAVHLVTTVVTSIGASRGRRAYAVAFVVATILHAGYNLGVTSLVA